MNIISANYVANNIIRKSFIDKKLITRNKLNYLIYLVYSSYLKKYNIKLFNEGFVKTYEGPILPSVYYKFNCYKNKSIKSFSKDANDDIYFINDDNFLNILNKVWYKYKDMSEIEIFNFINLENYYCLKFNEIIKDELILFDEKIRNNEKKLLYN